jgi:hypothetical protein
MNEPSLSCGPLEAADTYRLTWLRTFHHPIAVRVARRDRAFDLVGLELNGAGGYGPGTVMRRVQKTLSRGDWGSVEAAITQAAFWRMPTKPNDDARGADGSEWIFEGRRDSGYHIVVRWSPDGGAYRRLGLTLVQLAGLAVPPDELY